MTARLLLPLIVLCLAGPAHSQEWNLFAANTTTSDRCLVEWDLFAPAALVADANESCESWNMFAVTVAQAQDPAAKYGDRVLLLLSMNNCDPCKDAKALVPALEKAGWPVRIVKFDQDPGFFDELGVDAVPAWLAVMRSKECGRYVGRDKSELFKMLRDANRVIKDGG